MATQTTDPENVTAQWNDGDHEYRTVIGGVELWSDDGSEWMPVGSATKLPPGFDGAKILLIGGPQDGKEVL